MEISQFGTAEGWTGHSATKAWYGLFGSSAQELSESDDARAALFWTQGHSFESENYKQWKWIWCYQIQKYRFERKWNTNNIFKYRFSTFELTDAHLMSAEATLRGGGGSNADALAYINAVVRSVLQQLAVEI